MPRPSTTNVSPSVGCARRTPCSAIAPSVTVLAASGSRPAGTATTRLRGTRTISAWLAYCEPAQATRSPGRRSSTPAPTSRTSPAAEYPVGLPAWSFPATTLRVWASPCVATISRALRTFAGSRRARFQRGTPLPCRPLISVPAEMQERSTRIRTVPGSTTGAGTSSTTACPWRIRTCFKGDPPGTKRPRACRLKIPQ